nr:DUF2252 domain-containing protein [Nocardioides perillae]
MSDEARSEHIVTVLEQAFAPLVAADPAAFRTKYRKMARDPHAFYRGTACLFFADVTAAPDPWARHGADRIWVHGDLHVENFGTYLSSDGRLVFDVNDFDEAYLGHFTWDVQRFAASLALTCWQKALPEDAVRALVGTYVDAYLDQVDRYRATDDDEDFGLRLDNTTGHVQAALAAARLRRRGDVLDPMTRQEGDSRVFRDDAPRRRLDDAERERVLEAFAHYLTTIPPDKRIDRDLFYQVRDVVGVSGFGIGSAGLPAYNVLVEGRSEALDDDVVLSLKQANVPAVSRFVDAAGIEGYFEHEGHRTVVSQRALQVHTDPLLGHTAVDGVGYVVAELSPFEVDLEWHGITEPDDIREVVVSLGRATAKVHCASDEDSDQDLVDIQVEDAVAASVEGRREEFRAWVTDFAVEYAARVRRDHTLFVEAFRSGRTGISATRA